MLEPVLAQDAPVDAAQGEHAPAAVTAAPAISIADDDIVATADPEHGSATPAEEDMSAMQHTPTAPGPRQPAPLDLSSDFILTTTRSNIEDILHALPGGVAMATVDVTSQAEPPLLCMRTGDHLHHVRVVDRNWWLATSQSGTEGLVYRWYVVVHTPPPDGQFMLWHDQAQGACTAPSAPNQHFRSANDELVGALARRRAPPPDRDRRRQPADAEQPGSPRPALPWIHAPCSRSRSRSRRCSTSVRTTASWPA